MIQIQGVIEAPRVVIASNKTLRGMKGARIEGHGLGRPARNRGVADY